ncbi:hypothetical protein F5Y18DRAFT_354217 [Xylariaceae sp. FL1019]|nr:hypothetical protein F5Y18DRAFT_354217 [Xylariaceae sp. FL1019]
MIWATVAFAASLLLGQAYGAPGSVSVKLLSVGRETLENRMEGLAYAALESRQTPQTSNTTSDPVQWDIDTMAACMQSLSSLGPASNPSGMAICYNLVQLDTKAGTFVADLRMFQVSTPSGAWAGITPQAMQGSVSFNGATASSINGQNLTQNKAARDVEPERINKRQSVTPTLLRNYTIAGQINADKMAAAPMTLVVIEPLVMPVVTLTANNSAGQTLSTNLSSNEAVFVNGIFSKEVVLSSVGSAQLLVDESLAQLQNGTVAFVLPGVNILIFPIGGVITGFWAVVGITMYAYCSWERYNYRESYRRRKAMISEKSYMSRI